MQATMMNIDIKSGADMIYTVLIFPEKDFRLLTHPGNLRLILESYFWEKEVQVCGCFLQIQETIQVAFDY